MIGLISGTVSSYARTLGHWISIGVTGAMMILLNWFMIRAKQRFASYDLWPRLHGKMLPKVRACAPHSHSDPAIMAEPTRHVLETRGCGHGVVIPRNRTDCSLVSRVVDR